MLKYFCVGTYAARAGTETSRYWGNEADEACRYANVADQAVPNCSDGYVYTAPAGHFMSNAFGLHDMLGNVWEWTQDWYGGDYYANSLKAEYKVKTFAFQANRFISYAL